MDEKPRLADLLGTKGYKTEKALKDAIAKALKAKAATGLVGKGGDHRISFKPDSKLYFVEVIEDVPPVTEDPKFGALMEGGNANPPVRKLPAKAARGVKKTPQKKAADRMASAKERLARVKAEANGEAAPRKRGGGGGPRTKPLPEMAEGVKGPWLLVAVGWPEASDPRHWALEYSRKCGVAFQVLSAETNAEACTVDYKALRSPRAEPRAKGELNDFDRWAIEQAQRKEGVLRTELREKAGRPNNWFGYLKDLAVTIGGHTVSSDKSGKVPRYRMVATA